MTPLVAFKIPVCVALFIVFPPVHENSAISESTDTVPVEVTSHPHAGVEGIHTEPFHIGN